MSTEASTGLQFFVNGDLVEAKSSQLESNLAEFLRDELRLTGTKIGCSVGGCGSCTVIKSVYIPGADKIKNVVINACITLIGSLNGAHILTIEGMSDPKDNSCHLIQDQLARGKATQCGFCSPGMVMSLYSLFSSGENGVPEELGLEEIQKSLQGNLCRCTGYRPIVQCTIQCAQSCVQKIGGKQIDIEDLKDLFHGDFQLEDPRKVNLKARIDFEKIHMHLKEFWGLGGKQGSRFTGTKWFTPSSLPDLRTVLLLNERAVLMAGGTDQSAFFEGANTIVLTKSVPEMNEILIFDEFVRFGAGISIQSVLTHLKRMEKKCFEPICEILERFGSLQIRNSATIGGSLMTGNRASDLQTLFNGLGWRLKLLDWENGLIAESEHIPSRESKQIILALEIPFAKENELIWCYKHSKRPENDLALVNCAFKISFGSPISNFDPDSRIIKILCSFGGLALDRFNLSLVEGESRKIDEDLMKEVQNALINQLSDKLSTDFDAKYIETLLNRIVIKIFERIKGMSNNPEKPPKPIFKAAQVYSLKGEKLHPYDLVGQPIPHSSALKHTTGEAKFCDDTLKYDNELSLALVLSSKAHAIIKNIDTKQAEAVVGYIGLISASDLSPEANLFGIVLRDEEIFARNRVNCHGQIIAGVVAKGKEAAKKAANLVKIEYEEIKGSSPILTLEEAIRVKSFFPDFQLKLESGDWANMKSEHTIEGKMNIGTQAHFALEPQACIGIPSGEDGEICLISSTQNPAAVQEQVAQMLGIPENKVVVKVKRVGGGFGGKETRKITFGEIRERCLLLALPVALACKKFSAPIRLILDRETDLRISGKRNAFRANYNVSFNSDGKLIGLQMNFFCNGGWSMDVSMAAIERALLNIDSAYNLPNTKLEGKICKTHLPSNTAMRGTGAPQAILLIENILDRISAFLGMDPIEVRRRNLYKDGDTTPYGQIISNSNVGRCFESCLISANYEQRLKKVHEFNQNNKWIKRGISLNPIQYGVGFTALHLNQATATVKIYRDGSILLNTGGVEIGQGLHTKLIQIASNELRVPARIIRILEVSTDQIVNATTTAASCTTDLAGMALLIACQKMSKRLEPYMNEEKSWEEGINQAYMDRVNLTANGFYKTPGMGWTDPEKLKGSPFNYFSTGSAISEVELDCLTGEFKILRTDIVMDIGQSINPGIDIGQVEGGYIQGVGFCTMEELITDDQGCLKTIGPLEYKIPTASTIPSEFNVTILEGSSNPKAVYSSKAIGEPPLLLASSVFFAIKECIREFRKSANLSSDFPLDSPATSQRILEALSSPSI